MKVFTGFKSYCLLTALICLLTHNILFAQTSGNTYTESYLLRNVGARAIAMGGAYTAIVNEPSALFYNPAGLSLLSKSPMVTTSFSFLQFGRAHNVIAWGQQVFDNLGFGIGINNYTGGSFTGRNSRGTPLAIFTDRQFDLAAAASYAMQYASFGVAFKYLANTLEGSGSRGDGYGVDLGTKFNIADLFSVGLCIQNLAGEVTWNTQSKLRDNLPFTLRGGVAMEFGLNDDSYVSQSTATGAKENIYVPATRYILISADASMTQYDNNPVVTFGFEAVPHEVIGIRGGIAVLGEDENKFRLFPMTVWGGGISIRPLMLDLPFKTNIDYSVGSDRISSNLISHHISLVFEF